MTNNIPTVSQKITALQLQEKFDAYNQARAEVDIIRQTIQNNVLDYLWDNYSIDPNLWFFNPDEPYFRLIDHIDRGMNNQDFIRFVINKNDDTNWKMVNISLGSHMPTQCKNINTLVETIQLQNYLLQALKKPETQQTIIDAHHSIIQTINETHDLKIYHDAALKVNYFKRASEFCQGLLMGGLDTIEKINEFLDSLETYQLSEFSQRMGLIALTSTINSHKKLKNIILDFYCLPDEIV
jgi:hypothetical protein